MRILGSFWGDRGPIGVRGGVRQHVQQFLATIGSYTFSRNSTQTFRDFEGLVKTAPEGVPAFPGARLVHNTIPAGSRISPMAAGSAWTLIDSGFATANDMGGYTTCHFEDSVDRLNLVDPSVLPEYQDVRMTAEVRMTFKGITSSDPIRLGIYNGTSFLYLDSHTPTLGEWQRISTPVVNVGAHGASPQLQIRAKYSGVVEFEVRNIQVEVVTGQANQNPSEFVDGAKYFTYENGCTVDANGIVTEAQGAAIPGIEGVLLEPAGTNQFYHSENLTDVYWNVGAGISVAASGTLLGGRPGFLISAIDTATSYKFFRKGMSVTGGSKYCVSALARKTNYRYIGIRPCVNDAEEDHIVYDFDTDSFVFVPATQVLSYGRELLPDGSVYLWAAATADSTGAITRYGGVAICDAAGAEYWAGAGTETVEVTALQFETGAFPTSYIKTEGATATRAATSLKRSYKLPKNGISGFVVFRPQFNHDDDKGNFHGIVSLYNAANPATNNLELLVNPTNDRIYFGKDVDGVHSEASIPTAGTLTYQRGDRLYIAFKADSAGLKFWVNGTFIELDGSGADWVNLLDTIDIGTHDGGDAYRSTIVVESLRIWNTAKADSYLEDPS